ncbi:MAG: hypothetical protein HZB62_16305 [Nitrospirae bacterium]|nr:hypothetical protein [Nitrospirota bacterium]
MPRVISALISKSICRCSKALSMEVLTMGCSGGYKPTLRREIFSSITASESSFASSGSFSCFSSGIVFLLYHSAMNDRLIIACNFMISTLCSAFAEVLYLLSPVMIQSFSMTHKSIKEWPENERPRERLLRHGAASMSDAQLLIFVHNHPSGNPSPSREDILITERLAGAGDIVGIEVLDHSIVAENGYTSMLEKGYLKAG